MHALKAAEAGVPVEELLRKYGVSRTTFYAWRKKYGGLEASEMKRLRDLEAENPRLKGLVADLSLDKQMLQELLPKKSEALAPSRTRPGGVSATPGGDPTRVWADAA